MNWEQQLEPKVGYEITEKDFALVNFIIKRNKLIWDEDLYSAGLLGLWKAAKSFNEGKGSFSNYAILVVGNELKMELYKRNFTKRNRDVKCEFVALNKQIKDSEGNGTEFGNIILTHEDDSTHLNCIDIMNLLSDDQKELVEMMVKGINQNKMAEIYGTSQASMSRKINKIRDIIRKEYMSC